ncbi:hypothetical protein GCM10020331_058110 [Ectobacillus funiculus]
MQVDRIQDKTAIQTEIDSFANQDVYVHLETTNGAYATHTNEKVMTVGGHLCETLVFRSNAERLPEQIPIVLV